MYILRDMFACAGAEVPSHEPLQMGVMDYTDPALLCRWIQDFTETLISVLMVDAVFNT